MRAFELSGRSCAASSAKPVAAASFSCVAWVDFLACLVVRVVLAVLLLAVLFA